VNAVIDTNVLVDYLRGIEAARKELLRYRAPAISVITWMEVLSGAQSDEEERQLRTFLDRFELLSITQAVADQAVHIRRADRLRLPDAIIWATARSHHALLVTRNTRDFPADHPSIRIPYQV
jgi:predicted nucleic acid-binding protein